jgi:ribonuclease E
MELATESTPAVDKPEPAVQTSNSEESAVVTAEPEKEAVIKPVKKAPVKKAAKKATSLKVAAKTVKKESVSAPMARPASVDEAFVEIKIGSIDDAARPEVKRSGKSAAFSSSSNAATAPATRPGE